MKEASPLRSPSEGLPLVILEGFAAGIPLVATDVGACRELVYGRAPADQALGSAGIITRVSAPTETADALLHFVHDPGALTKMGLVGRKRVETYYTQRALLERYHNLYTDRSWSTKLGPDTPSRAPARNTA